MIYHLSLRTAALASGLFLILATLPGLVQPAFFQDWARRLPRSRVVGVVLFTLAAIWAFWLLSTMEMGEFAPFRRPLLIILPIGYVLVLRFVDEFLAVRALGILCLLAAEPLLDAAFLRSELARLVLTVFAYLIIVVGLFWVTMPYLLRDQINWTSGNLVRWRSLHGLALLYGGALVVLALAVY